MRTRPADAGALVRLRALRVDDLDAVLAIENASFTTPWRLPTFEGLLRRGDTDLVAAEREGRLVGYAICWTVVDQAELGNVAVDPAERGRGTGRLLVEESVERVSRRGAREVFLEVRESNAAAQALYKALGFLPIGRRKRYYTLPIEDAVVMRLAIV